MLKWRMCGEKFQLLRQNISIPQLLGYAFAALTGMSVIFSAFCFSRDIRPLFAPATGLFKPEYLVVNKKVSLLATFNSDRTAFSPSEIDEISRQEFVRSLSCFTSCRFRVKAYTQPSSRIPPFSTDLFFESVPDRLLDSAVPDWRWDEQSGVIPIMIPRDYLSLYNFGFAGSQGLPQISEAVVQQVVFRVAVSGNERQQVFDGRIAGFSDYLNTILVPDAFMQWANERFGEGAASRTSRLIIETDNPADPAIAAFFAAEQNYDVSGNRDEPGKLSHFLSLLIAVVMIVGTLIMLPAVGLMILSINLLVYKNQKTLGNLVLLGYRRSRLAGPYCLLALALNTAVGTASFAIAGYAQNLYAPGLAALGITDLSGGPGKAGFAILFVLLVTALDILWIRRKINKIKTPARG
ncbi:MAG: ABC transporter permease [Bacteroidales bacterium]|nr:ABC transporter permease [Bacteroidales bacterium]